MLTAFVVAVVVGAAAQPLVIRHLRRRGVLDCPTARSSHSVPTPRGGGVAVVLALLAGAIVGGAGSDVRVVVVLVVTALCAMVGLVEDVRGVAIVPRFALLLSACTAVAFLVHGPPALTPLLVLAATAFCVGVVNATNFMDGINGISAAQGATAGLAFAVLSAGHGLDELAVVGTATAAAFVSFLPYNVPRARVFLGDSGSYALGAVLASTAVALIAHGVPVETALAPLAICLADTGTTLVRRFRAGEPWYLPHRTHVYQRLTDGGMSHVRVSGIALVFMVLCVIMGALPLMGGAARVTGDVGLLLVVLTYLSLPQLASRRRMLA